MGTATPEPVTIEIDDAQRVSGLLQAPAAARACYVLAHGAGAGMAHRSWRRWRDGLAERGIATLRYQFPSWSGAEAAGPAAVAQAAVRAAVAAAARLLPGLPPGSPAASRSAAA